MHFGASSPERRGPGCPASLQGCQQKNAAPRTMMTFTLLLLTLWERACGFQRNSGQSHTAHRRPRRCPAQMDTGMPAKAPRSAVLPWAIPARWKRATMDKDVQVRHRPESSGDAAWCPALFHQLHHLGNQHRRRQIAASIELHDCGFHPVSPSTRGAKSV